MTTMHAAAKRFDFRLDFGFKVLAICIAASSLSACIPIALTTATVTAVDVSADRRSAGRYLDDNTLEVKLRNDISIDPEIGSGINVSVTVVNGIVLLTGEVNTDQQRQRVSEIANASEQASKVVNELQLAGKTNFSSRINDGWITIKVKTKLLAARGVPSSAIKVVTEHGKVYLLGLVTRAESDSTVAAIRSVKGITHIVKVFEYIPEPEPEYDPEFDGELDSELEAQPEF